MIDDFKQAEPANASSEKPKPLDIYDNNESLKSAAVQRPVVDFDELEDMMGKPETYELPSDGDEIAGKTSLSARLQAWWHTKSKKQQIILIVISLVALGVVSGVSAYFIAHKNKPKATAITQVTKKPVDTTPPITTVASALTGLQVDPAANTRPVIGVIIENSKEARPQSGLDQAGVVFEAIAEGGITRFLALFQDTQPDLIGPIRSVRPYYQHWAMGFDSPMAHVGGSPEALANVKAWGIKDIDQFYNSGGYHRSSNRAAPHNVYSSAASLNQLATQKGYTASKFTSLTRKAEKPYKASSSDTRTAANIINMNISSASYNTRYEYDKATNSYKRIMAGAAHMSLNAANAQTQITPKVVIALAMPYSIQSDGKHSVYGTIGSGQMYVFQDGTVTSGTWSKASSSAQFSFVDAAGKPLALNPGQTWITAVKAIGNVTSQ